jgi:hypothetical protein
MGDDLEPNGLSMVCSVFLFKVDVAEIVVHKAYEPNSIVDLLYAEP